MILDAPDPAPSNPAAADPGSDELLELADRAIELVDTWLTHADGAATRSERATTEQLAGVVADPDGVRFGMGFVDRVIRPDDDAVAAAQLRRLVSSGDLPGFLSAFDRLLLRAGGRIGPWLPGIVMPLARRRMRSLIGHLVVDAESDRLARHLRARSEEGFRLNVNQLGEAVLGEREAAKRHDALMHLLDEPDVDYVSVKVSAVVSQLNHWDFDGSLERVLSALRPLFERAAAADPATFVNLDMEEYHDLELTLDAFTTLLAEDRFHHLDAGIVLQAYLPDSFDALRRLTEWANARRERVVGGRPGGTVKVRLVKGANLAMERVDAAIHGWAEAPYGSKAETDANYKRCLDWLLRPDRMTGMKVGVASHNLFDLAFAMLLAEARDVSDRVEFEMLEGMAPTHARLLRDAAGMLLYTPVVERDEFDVAISYLFRRLEENAADENFVHHLFSMTPGGPSARSEAERFRVAVRDRWTVSSAPRRSPHRAAVDVGPFANAPDTDPALPANRAWARTLLAADDVAVRAPLVTETSAVDEVMAVARRAQPSWEATPVDDRRAVLRAVADELERRRGDLVAAMVHEGRKTVAQADPEVSEAVDFARYYGDRARDLVGGPTDFHALGVVLVAPPWNFPVAIPTGGVMASLAAGNAVVLKPAPETRRCAEIVAEVCWDAGVPTEAMQFVSVPDDEVGRHLVAHPEVDAVILTGAHETAELFRSWRPDLRIFAETSGKNALVVTPNADLDLAVADLVDSAFGHSGQKCSAASLAILVGGVAHSTRFHRQLVDAVSSLQVGQPTELSTTMGPTISASVGKLERALTTLDDGESWLVEPRRTADGIWTPGVRIGVQPGSWFHRTECFGPVLGIVHAETLDEAIDIQNGTDFGLTGGIHTLDATEIEHWLERVEVGNAYVNRATTGAIVQRQPFGGWKRSSIGPGAKAGGPNYVAQLGHWAADPGPFDDAWLADAARSDELAWQHEFGVEHDPTGLFCESNRFRYRPIDLLGIWVSAPGHDAQVRRVLAGAERCGVATSVCDAQPGDTAASVAWLRRERPERLRVIGPVEPELRAAANELGIHVADAPVLGDGRRELLHVLREQAISQTMHRYGNLL